MKKEKKNMDILYETDYPKAISDENINIENIQVVSNQKGKIYLKVTAKNTSDKKISKSFLEISTTEKSINHKFRKKLKPDEIGYSDDLIDITSLNTDRFESLSFSISVKPPKKEKKNKQSVENKKQTKIKQKKPKDPIALLLISICIFLILIGSCVFMIKQLSIKTQLKGFLQQDSNFPHIYISALKSEKDEIPLDKYFIELEKAKYNLKSLKFKSMIHSYEKYDIEILTLFQQMYIYKKFNPSKNGSYKNSDEMKKCMNNIFSALEAVSKTYEKEKQKESFRAYLQAALLSEQYLFDIDMKNIKSDLSIVSKNNDDVPIIELFKIYKNIINRSKEYIKK